MSSPSVQPSPLEKRRSPLMELLVIAAPTVAQTASYTVMQFIDTKMLADYGQSSGMGNVVPTAANNGGMFMFSLLALGFGTLFVVNTLASQSFGRFQKTGDQHCRNECGRYMWQGVWVGLAYGLMILPLIPLGQYLLTRGHSDAQLIDLEKQYFLICTLFAPLKLASVSVGQYLIAVGRPNQALVATIAGVLADIFVNWLLIFGNWGFPEMGVAGAAWGTNAAVSLELGVLAFFAARPAVRVFGAFDWKPRLAEMKQLIKIGLPSGFQFLADIVPWTIFMTKVIAEFGDNAMAANAFAFRYMVTSFLPAVGISIAVTALVGRSIGKGERAMAYTFARLGFLTVLGYLMICLVAYVFFARPLLSVFNPEPEVMPIALTLMKFAAAFLIFDGLYIIYSGALRGAGDTFLPAVVTAVLCTGMLAGVAWAVAVLRPQWGVAGPWTVAMLYGLLISAFMWLRFVGGRWERIHIEQPEADFLGGGFPIETTVDDPSVMPAK